MPLKVTLQVYLKDTNTKKVINSNVLKYRMILCIFDHMQSKSQNVSFYKIYIKQCCLDIIH